MSRGRPPEGAGLVENLEGSEPAKKRLRVILETIAGEKTVRQACGELGMGKSAFHKLRSEFLRGAVEDLEPKSAGRPRKEVSPEEERVENLEAEVRRLRAELDVSHVKEELMLAMPQLFNPERASKKKGRGKK